MWSVRRSYLSGVTFWLCGKINAKITFFSARRQASAPIHIPLCASAFRARISKVSQFHQMLHRLYLSRFHFFFAPCRAAVFLLCRDSTKCRHVAMWRLLFFSSFPHPRIHRGSRIFCGCQSIPHGRIPLGHTRRRHRPPQTTTTTQHHPCRLDPVLLLAVACGLAFRGRLGKKKKFFFCRPQPHPHHDIAQFYFGAFRRTCFRARKGNPFPDHFSSEGKSECCVDALPVRKNQPKTHTALFRRTASEIPQNKNRKYLFGSICAPFVRRDPRVAAPKLGRTETGTQKAPRFEEFQPQTQGQRRQRLGKSHFFDDNYQC